MLRKFYVGTALVLFAVSVFLGLDRVVHHKSNRFSLDNITSAQISSPEWDLPLLSEEEKETLDQILSQKFTYYSKSSQGYAFISEDKKYILKFLKQNKFQSHSWLAHIPFSLNPYYQKYLFKQKKCKDIYSACTTAFLQFRKETGLVYVHINNRRDLNKKVEIFDKNEKCHVVDIDRTTFYVQRRAQFIYSRIAELMHHGDLEGAKNIISSIFSLIVTLGEKGVVDNDPILRKNFGLVDDMAVQLDLGKFRSDSLCEHTTTYRQEVRNITHSFKDWVDKNYPELSEHFNQCLKAATASE